MRSAYLDDHPAWLGDWVQAKTTDGGFTSGRWYKITLNKPYMGLRWVVNDAGEHCLPSNRWYLS